MVHAWTVHPPVLRCCKMYPIIVACIIPDFLCPKSGCSSVADGRRAPGGGGRSLFKEIWDVSWLRRLFAPGVLGLVVGLNVFIWRCACVSGESSPWYE